MSRTRFVAALKAALEKQKADAAAAAAAAKDAADKAAARVCLVG
jgi:hypothetical protein